MESRINDSKRKRVVVVGGSIAGLCCAHSLLRSEWLEVLVFERARSVTAAGAGLGVGPRACDALRSWGLGDALESSSLPLSMEEVRLRISHCLLIIISNSLSCCNFGW